MSFPVAAGDRTRAVYAAACKGRLAAKKGFPSGIPNIGAAWIPGQAVVLHLLSVKLELPNSIEPSSSTYQLQGLGKVASFQGGAISLPIEA